MGENNRNYSWAVFLVLVGTMLLLNTTGLIGWGIWQYIVRFWPVLVILIGIKIILGNSTLAKTLEILFTLLLTLFVFGASYIQYTASGIKFLPKNVNDWVLKGGSGMFNFNRDSVEGEMSVLSEEFSNIGERDVKIYIGAGRMNLIEEDRDEYIYIKQQYPEIYRESVLEKEEREGVLNLDFRSASPQGVNLFLNESVYDISVGQVEIPTTFDIEIGAGDADVTLQNLPVNDLYTKVGAGNLDISLSKYSIPSGDIFFNVGAGKMTVTLPSTVGYIFEYDLGVGNIYIDGKEISEFGSGTGKYTSSNYEDADVKIDMNVSVGVGSFNLKTN